MASAEGTKAQPVISDDDIVNAVVEAARTCGVKHYFTIPGRERLRELRVEELVRENGGRDVAQRGDGVVGGGGREERRQDDPGRDRPSTRANRDLWNRLRVRQTPSGRLHDRGKESVHATRIGSYRGGL